MKYLPEKKNVSEMKTKSNLGTHSVLKLNVYITTYLAPIQTTRFKCAKS